MSAIAAIVRLVRVLLGATRADDEARARRIAASRRAVEIAERAEREAAELREPMLTEEEAAEIIRGAPGQIGPGRTPP